MNSEQNQAQLYNDALTVLYGNFDGSNANFTSISATLSDAYINSTVTKLTSVRHARSYGTDTAEAAGYVVMSRKGLTDTGSASLGTNNFVQVLIFHQ